MNSFDIIGPVMVGPSSSHTAGAVRIGRVARRILGHAPRRIRVGFHGSFAATYRGHGSDRAVIAGLLDFAPDDSRVPQSLEIAAQAGIEITFDNIDLPGVHPNTMQVEAESEDGTRVQLVAHSVGGGSILVTSIDGIDVEYRGVYDTIIVSHTDAPGAVAQVANLLAAKNINIAGMKVYRSRKGGEAIMVIESDEALDKELARAIEQLPLMLRATIIGSIA